MALPVPSRDRVQTAALMMSAQAVNLAGILLVTRLYTPAAFGRYAAVAAVAAVAGGAGALRLDVAAATAATERDATLLLRIAARLNGVVGVVVALLAVAWAAVVGDLDRPAFVEAVALGALTTALGLSGTMVYARVRDRRYRLVAVVKLVTTLVQGVAMVAFALLGDRSATVLLAATALGYATGALLLFRPRPPAAGVGVRDVLRRHRPFMTASAPASLINGLTLNVPLFVAAAVSSVAAADLALALRVGALPSALLGQALMPILFGEIAHQLRSSPRRARASYDRALAGLSVAGVVLLTGLAVGTHLAAPLVFGAEWAGAATVLLLLLPFLVGQFAVVPLSQTLAGTGGNRQQLLWDVGRLLTTGLVFLPTLAGWISWSTSLLSFSLAMAGWYGGHVLLTRAALTRARPVEDRPASGTTPTNPYGGDMIVDADVITTAHWRLRAPTVASAGRTVCVPTVHPVGDRRVLRCAQAVLDAGFDVHLIWLGGEPGESRPHPRVRETRLPEPTSARQRLRLVPAVAAVAERTHADLWHIHDYYLLPRARRWSRRTGRPVLYDVHEYYPEYYSQRFAAPAPVQHAARRLVAGAERWYAGRLGAANAVSEQLADRFRALGLPAVATPNYPSADAFARPARPLTPDLLRRVVHTGSLTTDYGADVLVGLAVELARRAPDVEVLAVSRFPSEAARRRFTEAVARAGHPTNLRMLDPVPAHEVADLLATCGIGLSLMQDVGEARLSVNSKFYEYAIMGLAVVTSDLPAARHFVEEHAVGRCVPPASPDRFAQAITDLLADAEATCAAVDRAAARARDELSWERTCAPRLRAIVRHLLDVGDGLPGQAVPRPTSVGVDRP
ncbi:glycosyltransferase [Micromonospora echinospora]|uniref:glycosyltransferase n=1 Tax=Micromonospora echinospora TaxID=1877 RepID=UPI0022AAD404|nr:glycosyltransferase [Micromonospora echinospora]